MKAVQASTSIAGCLRHLGLKLAGGNHRSISGWIKFWDIDTSHFTGAGWARGLTRATSLVVNSTSQKMQIPDEIAFSANSPPSIGARRLRKYLFSLKREYRCGVCKLTTWLGEPIGLDVDHVNGNPRDNRAENLRFLCPNCHRQTPTWGTRRK